MDIPTLNYFFTPVVVIVIGSWFIAHSFMGVRRGTIQLNNML